MGSLTCPGCSNHCSFKIPTSFSLPSITFPALSIPSLPVPHLPTLPTLPPLPTSFSGLFSFAGTLPTFNNPAWAASHGYKQGDKIDVQKPFELDKDGKELPAQRTTILTYQVILPTSPTVGTSGSTEPTWGPSKVVDGTITWKLIASRTGVAGTCPNSEGSKK